MAAWGRQPGETARTFALFAAYRDLGPLDRSLARVARESGRSLASVEQASRRHGWVARCGAWDAENERARRAALTAELEAMARRQVLAGQLLQGRGLRRIQALMDKEVADLTISEALRLVVTGVRLERQARGEPADRWRPAADAEAAEGGGDDTPLIEILRRHPSSVGPVVGLIVQIQALLPELGGAAGREPEDGSRAGDADLADLLWGEEAGDEQ